jgi:hypothetical protein
MTFEGLICPACTTSIEEEILKQKLVCPHCKTNLKQKKFLAFIEFLIMQGLVNVDFFDEVLYGEEVKKTVEEKELQDETDPDDYEDKSARIEYVDEKHDLNEVTTDEKEFREWEGIEEDWQDFNRKHISEENKRQQ